MKFILFFLVLWAALTAITYRQLGVAAAWFWLCQLFAFFILMPVGWVVVGAACYFKAWTPGANVPSIKPLPMRQSVDRWTWPINAFYGNPEDGVSGMDAIGPNWPGSYNPQGTRWLAFKWSGLRNWANGFSYLTWLWKVDPNDPPPIYFGTWLGGRPLKFGWQRLPVSDGWNGHYAVRMVCSP